MAGDKLDMNLAAAAESAQEGPFTVPGQIRGPLCGYGACDPLFRDSPSALLAYRFSTGAFQLTPGADTLTLPANSQISLFVSGVGQDAGEQGYPAGLLMNDAMTDVFRDGTPVERGQLFVATGMTLSVKQPVRLAQAAPFGRTYPAALDLDENSKIQQVFLQNVAIEFVYGNTACRYRLGAVDHWADWAGATGPTVSNGSPTAGVFLPFRAATVISARDEARKLTVNLKAGSQPIVIGAVGVAAQDDPYFVEIQLKLVGFPICAQDTSCGLPSNDDERIARIVRQMMNK